MGIPGFGNNDAPTEGTKENEVEDLTADLNKAAKKSKKEHKLGPLVKIKAHALSLTDKKGQIFCSINQFNFEFQQNTVVELPKEVVKFLQGASKLVHTTDDNNKPIAKNEPLYAISVIL